MALVGAVAVGLVLRYRSLARLPEQLRQQAFAAGITIKIGAVSVRPLATTVREVELAFPRAPGVSAVIDRATLRPAAGGLPDVTIEHVHIALEATALPQLEELARSPFWRQLTATWGHLSVTFANRLVGHLDLDDVRVDGTARPGSIDGGSADGQAPGAPLSLVAGKVTLGERSWSDVALSLARRNQMLEIPLGDASTARAPLVVRTFPTQGGITRWVLALAHRPATELASAVGWAPGGVPSGLRLGGSLTFNVPDDAHQPITGRVDLVSDGWPAPDVPEGAAFMGRTVAFGARIEPARDRTQARLAHLQLATSTFTLSGSGSLALGADPRLALDVEGSLTCAQMRGNLPPSDARAAVLDFVAGNAGSRGGGDARPPRTKPERDRQTVALRVQIDAALTDARADARHLAMKLAPGCGLAGFTVGAFAKLDLDAQSPASPTPPARPAPKPAREPAPKAAPAAGAP